MIKEFYIGAVKWTVNEVKSFTDNHSGESDPFNEVITIAQSSNENKFSDQYKELTLYHEAVHAWLDSLGYHKLNTDETFVQGMAILIHQFENTKK